MRPHALIALLLVESALAAGPIASMRDETRALVRAEWTSFSPGVLQSFQNGHGMLVFHGEPKTPPAHESASARSIDGILVIQCPTRRAALSFVRFLDGERRDLGAERADDPRFFFAAAGGAVDVAVERVCVHEGELGYRPAEPVIAITAWRDLRIGEALPEKLPACAEFTPKRHAELLAASDKRCRHGDADRPDASVTVYAPNPASDKSWQQNAVVLLRERRIAGVYEFVGPSEADAMLEMAVRSFGLPTIVRSTAIGTRYKRELFWVGDAQVVVFLELERAHPSGGVYSAAGYVSREHFEISRATPPQ